jgi:hypothetical protein
VNSHGEVPAPLRLAAEYRRRFNDHDFDGLSGLRAESFAIVDHRRRREEEPDSFDTAAERWRPEFASLDVSIAMDELLACDERVIALRAAVRGTAPDG